MIRGRTPLRHGCSPYNGNNSSVSGCTFSGAQPTTGAWYDPTREYNFMIADYGHDHNSVVNNTFQNVWPENPALAEGATNFTFSNNSCRNNGAYCVHLNQTGGTPGAVVQNNVLVDSNMGVEDSANVAIPASCVDADTGCPNQSILISGNDISAVLGTGYYRSQTALGLWFFSSAHLDCGTSASGGAPSANEYYGVTCSGNHIHGLNTGLFPASGTNYPTSYGETMSGNTCDQGCNGSAP